MPQLTRRRDPDALQEAWLVYCGDVHVGTIAIRSGIPYGQAQWGWRCGFYPGSEPGEYLSGIAATFDQPRADRSLRLQDGKQRKREGCSRALSPGDS